VLVHAGPSADFFHARAFLDPVELLEPDVHLELSPGAHGNALGDLLIRLERILVDVRPDLLLVRGDSDAALAGALAAARQGIPTARLDAGVRAYAKRLPHELNRLLTDRLADVLFCHSDLAVRRLAAEGLLAGVHWCGDLGLDVVAQYLPVARQRSSILQRVGLYPGYYLLALLRPPPARSTAPDLLNIVKALNAIREPIVLPVSSRLRTALDQIDLPLAPHVLAIDPLGYLDTLQLEAHARAILTDAVSAQREAYHLAVPCITLSAEIEVRETVDVGWNCLAGNSSDQIIEVVRNFLPPLDHPLLFGDGRAAENIAAVLSEQTIVFGQNYDRASLAALPPIAVD
jgi:UDP-N-acetylglucosamine 2-epimerase